MRKWNRGDAKRTDPTQAWTLDGLGPCDSLPSLEGTLGEEARMSQLPSELLVKLQRPSPPPRLI